MTDTSSVDLGFLEEPDQPWRLHPCYFPSKVGGKPAWLDPKNIPSSKSLLCKNCSKPMIFLLQIYAPVDDYEHCFHRSIFVFCCKNGICYSQKDNPVVQAFTCTLSRDNSFYRFDPPDYESGKATEASISPVRLCSLCGCAGDKSCGRCKQVYYCGRDHQVLDWKTHKTICGKQVVKNACNVGGNCYLFPEKEIVIESEEELGSKDEYQKDSEKLSKLVSETISEESFSTSELEDAVSEQTEDKTFSKFKQKIENNPDQVIRFKPGGKPLWCSDVSQPQVNYIPNCQCGSNQKFEFQVMPQLLAHLNVDASIDDETIDWATIAIYTCSNNCKPTNDTNAETGSYVRCFTWMQRYS